MSVWVWVLVVSAGWLAVSILVGLALAVVLSRLEGSFSELLEHTPWSSVPLLRSNDSAADVSTGDADSAEEVSAEDLAGRIS